MMLRASEAGTPLMYVHDPMMRGFSGFAEFAVGQLASAFRTTMAASGDNSTSSHVVLHQRGER